MQTVDRLGKELDPRLHDILKDGLLKYFKGVEQTPYDTPGSKTYHQLQTNQRKIGWDNLIRGKFSSHWRKHQQEFTQENKRLRKDHEMRTECMRTKEIPKKKKKKNENSSPRPKRKTDIFQRLFSAITDIIHELWLERNEDCHNPAKGQIRIAKITEAERTVTELYSVRHLILPEHDSTYFAIDLPQMLERTYSQMLRWANRWRIGIYHSMKRAAIAAKGLTIPIYKIWYPDRPAPRKRVDRRRLTSRKPIKYKDIKITNKMKVTKTHQSTSTLWRRLQRLKVEIIIIARP